jgi:hypothetical protein
MKLWSRSDTQAESSRLAYIRKTRQLAVTATSPVESDHFQQAPARRASEYRRQYVTAELFRRVHLSFGRGFVHPHFSFNLIEIDSISLLNVLKIL